MPYRQECEAARVMYDVGNFLRRYKVYIGVQYKVQEEQQGPPGPS
jgi:hypothetical protein